jgi:hypothetical protein
MTSVALGQIVYSFIEDHRRTQKGLSPLSIKSYRDTLRLFLIFTARNAGCRIARLSLEHIQSNRVRNLGHRTSLNLLAAYTPYTSMIPRT